jgi:hypothetical protein
VEELMRHARKFTTAIALAGLVGSWMMLGTARLEAKGKNSGDGTICSALLAVITYKYTSPTIRAYATGLYLSYGCDASLLQ